MLSKEKRLNLKSSFSWVASGERAGNTLFKVFFRFGENTQPKIGIATAKSTFKKAVDRNKARRVTSFGFERLYRQLPSNVNIIVLPKEGILKLSGEEVYNSMFELLKKKGLVNETNNY